MSVAPRLFTVDSAYSNQRLDNFLLRQLKGVPKTYVYRLIRQGKIRVNKGRRQPSYRVQAQDIIRTPPIITSTNTLTLVKPSQILKERLEKAILFENEYYLIIDKPYGLAVHGGSGISLGLIESLRQLYPKIPHLELAHRLDRETSGCLLVAKKPSTLKKLHHLFREKIIRKTYLHLAKGHWPQQLTSIDKPLLKNRLQSGERMVRVDSNGQSALTRYKVRQYYQSSTLIEAIPHTGRTHQLRVHAKAAGHPILGDMKYGDELSNQAFRIKGLKRLFLHAYQLTFSCPETGKVISVVAPLPNELKKVVNTEGGT